MKNRPSIFEIGEEACNGCFLCADVCSRKAIELRLDNDGFYKPYVNPELCNSCGLCAKMCPVCAGEATVIKKNTPDVYAGWSLDDDVRLKSSSGGFFYEMAKAFIDAGGAVCGVKWNSGVPKFDIAHTVEELRAFMGSKYLQADVSGIYARARLLVRSGKKVLFVGVPCQVQAISNYIKSDLLYTIDLVCAGVPSLKMYRKYCQEYFPGETVTKVNFRVKNFDDDSIPLSTWRDYAVEFYSHDRLLLSQKHNRNPFFVAFNSAKCYNTSCYSCRFNTLPRRGNMTLCDYWGANGDMDCEKGTSLLLVNDAQGDAFVEEYIRDCGKCHLRRITDSTPYKGTPRIDMEARTMPVERKRIFECLEKEGFKGIEVFFVPSFLRKAVNVIKSVLMK